MPGLAVNFQLAPKVGIMVCFVFICCASDIYTDLWAVQVDGGEAAARLVAEKHGFVFVGRIMPDFYHFRHKKVAKRSTDAGRAYSDSLADDSLVKWYEQQVVKKRVKRDVYFNDPKWTHMWYLRRTFSSGPGLDMNVQGAWAKGYTGKGVVVTILDDGIEKTHPDLERNYDPDASYDVNDRDYDPSPRYDNTNENRHGTRCAGEVAAVANNGICSVGVAHEAGIGGIRMLDGDVTDSVEANALSYNSQYVDIYSVSWGPEDDGKTVDGPGSLARRAFRDGVAKGRGGKGSIFVWASGNGGRDLDNCNCDGYTNSIYTLSISSVTENGYVPWYSEACSSTLATAFSSGGPGEREITTTDLRRNCTDSHTGTSASAPLAAGICALVLQANPKLTWRDMQHLVVMTASPVGLHSLGEWRTNGAGRNVSHNFGYGMMNAAAMVTLAVNWTSVPEQHICEIESARVNELIPAPGKVIIPLTVDGCAGDADRHVKYLEHVQAKISLASSRRGDVSIYLRSPMGTLSTLLAQRPNDNSKQGFTDWAFMTTHTWGELAQGMWQLEVHNGYRATKPVRLRAWSLVLHGTDRSPLSGKAERGQPAHRSVGADRLGSQRLRQQQQLARGSSSGVSHHSAANVEEDSDGHISARSGKPVSRLNSWHGAVASRGSNAEWPLASHLPAGSSGEGGRTLDLTNSELHYTPKVSGGTYLFVHGDHVHELHGWLDSGAASGDGEASDDQSEGDDNSWAEGALASNGDAGDLAAEQGPSPSFSATRNPPLPTARRSYADFPLSGGGLLALRGTSDLVVSQHDKGLAAAVRGGSGRTMQCRHHIGFIAAGMAYIFGVLAPRLVMDVCYG